MTFPPLAAGQLSHSHLESDMKRLAGWSGKSAGNAAASATALVLVHSRRTGGHRVGGNTWACWARFRRLPRFVEYQSVGEVLEVPRQAEVARLDLQQYTPQLPQVQRHRATRAVGPQGVHQPLGQEPADVSR